MMIHSGIPKLDTAQMIEVDRLMIEEYGIGLIQMMENAGRNLAELSIRLLGMEGLSDKKVVILCGAGNNGGGGMVAARHLHNRGVGVRVVLVAPQSRLKEIPLQQWGSLKRLKLVNELEAVSLKEADLIIDAMIGYGLRGDPRGGAAKWIIEANESNSAILALDAPSGLDTTSGKPGNPCIKAKATMTLALPKVGLVSDEAQAVVGELYLADISVPKELYRGMGLKVPKLFEKDSIVRLT